MDGSSMIGKSCLPELANYESSLCIFTTLSYLLFRMYNTTATINNIQNIDGRAIHNIKIYVGRVRLAILEGDEVLTSLIFTMLPVV